ncbi:MAG: transcriptional regulator [Chloroflexota bacterium]|jgi:transcriptional regulator|nr:transcriptional regulator [Chloroflexota bacterium]
MYMPADFEVTDEALLHGLMERFGFATLVTVEDGRPLVSHLPLLLDRTAGEHGTLLGHMARANHQWESFAQSEALAIFQGEHGYVSPSWYETHPSVPTWNYLVIHAHGPARIVEGEGRTREILAALIARHERGFEAPWTMELPEPYLHSMVRGIVAFEMPLTRLEGKFKLSQNRPRRDQLRVIATLAASADPADQALAAAMRTVLGGEAE